MSTATSRPLTRRIRAAMSTDAPAAVILVRLVSGAVFLSEGIQKFLFPNDLGTGRFATIGIPAPGFFGPFGGTVEIACGLLLLAGLFTRLATIPLIIDMALAIALTKVPIVWGGSADVSDAAGFWDFAHQVRTDYAMLLSLIFLLIVGGGRWSLDAALQRRARH